MAIVQRGGGGALAHAGLEHPQLALLDGELDVAHVAVVVLEDARRRRSSSRPASSRPSTCLRSAMGLGVADAGDDVLALGVHQVVAVELRRRRWRGCA